MTRATDLQLRRNASVVSGAKTPMGAGCGRATSIRMAMGSSILGGIDTTTHIATLTRLLSDPSLMVTKLTIFAGSDTVSIPGISKLSHTWKMSREHSPFVRASRQRHVGAVIPLKERTLLSTRAPIMRSDDAVHATGNASGTIARSAKR